MGREIKKKRINLGFFIGLFVVLFLFISMGRVNAQSIRIICPNGGERWNIEENRRILWTAVNMPSGTCFYAELLHNGRRVGILFTNRCGISSWDWKVGQLQNGIAAPNTGYKIRIQTASGIFDESDNAFSLVSAGMTSTTPSIQGKLGVERQSSLPDIRPKVAQPSPSSMSKASTERDETKRPDSSQYHGPMGNIDLVSLEIVGQRNQPKPFQKGGRIVVEKEDVKDSIDIYNWFGVDIRYQLMNSGGREISGKVIFNHDASWCYTYGEKVEGNPYRLKPGETKWFTKRFFMTACHHETPFEVLDASGKKLFQGNIVCSPSLLRWLGWPPLLHADSVGGRQESDGTVKVSCYLNNGGGGPVRRNWSLTYHVTHPHGGSVFFKSWNYNEFPAESGKFGPVGEFKPIYGGGYYTFDCILESPYLIFLKGGERVKKLEYTQQLLLH